MKTALIFILPLFAINFCNAQWEKIRTNDGFTKVYANDKYLFVFADKKESDSQYGSNDIYVSEDNGDSFESTLSENYSQYEILFTDIGIFAKNAVSGYYKFNEKKKSWEYFEGVEYMTQTGRILNIPEEITDNEFPEIFEFNGIINYASFNNGLYYSDDQGQRFRKSKFKEDIYKFYSDESVVYAKTGNGLFSADKSGLKWNKIEVNVICEDYFCIDDFLFLKDKVLMSKDGIVYVTTDNFNTFSEYNEGIEIPSNIFWGVFFAKNDKYIFYSNEKGVYRRSID